jgi:class 3 adenylate cyclase
MVRFLTGKMQILAGKCGLSQNSARVRYACLTGEKVLANVRALIEQLERRMLGSADSADERLNKTLLVFSSALMGFGAVLWVAIYRIMGVHYAVGVPLGYLSLSAVFLGLFVWRGNYPLYRSLQMGLLLFAPFVMQWSIGSFITSSGVMLWAVLAPIGVMMLQGPRASIPWFFAYVVMTGLSGFFDYYLHWGPRQTMPMHTISVFFSLNFAGVSLIIFLLFGYFILEKQRLRSALDEQHRLLGIEQEKSERLLLSILPEPIAQRLKDEQSIADAHPSVSVMFADIVEFTRLAERVSPTRIVAVLNEVFSGFDALSERYALEKIKTIGDAYMVAGGLTGGRNYVQAVAEWALAAQTQIRGYHALAPENLGLHVGICTGPVAAGVIGTRRFIYDLWGNTVNVASRLSAEAAPGGILVDENTFSQLQGQYRFSVPRTIPIKGKGPMTVYQLEGRAESDAPATEPGH